MKESLSGILGEGTANIVLFILLFAAILVAIFIIYAIIKRMSGSSTGAVNYQNERHDPSSRLAVVDAAMVDNQRKLVLVRRDDVEHLILIGGPTDVVVEQNITPDNDYARGSRITEAQIARYQDDYQEDAAPNFAEEFSRAPARPISTMPASPLALSDVSKAAPAPQFNAPEPKPEPVMAPVREPVVNQTAPVAPPAPVFAPSAPTVAPVQKAPVSTPTPNFTRPAPAAPSVAPVVAKPVAPQPRTVMPAAPAPSAKPATRSHPAYPLSQVSQGVLTSTSAAAAAAAASVAVASSGRLDHVAAQKSASLDDVKPAQTAPAVVAPTIPAPVVEAKSEPSFDLNFSDKADDFASLDDALDQALFNDLSTDFFESEKPAAQKVEDDMAFMLEEELLSSLDMEMDIEADLSVDIEDEMEKLLGELSINPER